MPCSSCGLDIPAGQRFCGACGAAAAMSSQMGTIAMAAAAPAPTSLPVSSTSVPDEGRFPPGTVLAQRYRIAARLGQGGMGEIYKATDLLVGQVVALKFLSEAFTNHPAAVERFRNEVRLARQVSHPNVCRMYDMGEAEGHLFLTMEFVDGEDLSSLLRRIGRLPSDKATEIARQVCAGLAAAHEKNVLHRDLKPANIMIDGRGQARITDFGLAGISGLVQQAEIRHGTPAYMAPEQLEGTEVSARSDIYGLGLVLFELFTAKRPFEAGTVEEMLRKQRQSPPSLTSLAKDIDPAVERVVARCLDSDPRKRPSSALAVAADLPGGDPLAAALAAGETPSPSMVAAAGSAESVKPRIAAACLCALAAGLALLAWTCDHWFLNRAFPSELGPEALAQQARTVLSGLGYPKPAAATWGFGFDAGAFFSTFRRGRIVPHTAGTPPAVYFWYRTAPQRLAPWRFTDFAATEDDPPHLDPGTINLRLDTEGHLTRLYAIPPRVAAAPPSPEFDWKRLFDAAGLDFTRFRSTTPIATAPMMLDSSLAWADSDPAGPQHVEAGLRLGHPVWFTFAHFVGNIKTAESAMILEFATNLAGLLIAVLWAWRNLRRKSADLPGAARLALLVFACTLASKLLEAHHGLDAAELERTNIIFAISLYGALFAGAMYLAFEPYVRRRWPHSLIGWTRLLNGSYRDPRVGRDVLAGLAAGAFIVCPLVWTYIADGSPGPEAPLNAALSSAAVFSRLANNVVWPVYFGCLMLLGVAVVSRIVRSRWAAAAVIAFLLAAPSLLNHNPREFAVLFLGYLGGLALLLQFGLLAIVANLWIYRLTELPLTLNSSSWFFYATPIAFAVTLALGIWSFYIATAGRKLLPDE